MADLPSLARSARAIIEALGEDPDREGLVKTPERVAKAYEFLTQGYQQDVSEIIHKALFHEQFDEMVFVRDVDFYSLCEHHMLPFYGKCHVAYIPNGKIVGLSKIPRVVEAFARRLQVQERMTEQIANAFQEHLKPKGVAVVVEGFHMCMAMRGVQQQNSSVTTSAMLGLFREDARTRKEFLELISNRLRAGF